MEINTSPTPACVHAAHFAGPDGKFTHDSIMNGQKKWGITGKLAGIRAEAILKACGEEKTPEAICKVVNYARSKIWNEDGTFNEEQFNKLKEHAVTSDDGKEVVTLSIFKKFLSDLHGNSFSGVMVYVYCLPITYHQVTEGSVSDFFDKFSDCTYKDKKAMSFEKLRQFYTNPKAASQEVEVNCNTVTNWGVEGNYSTI